jgi:hypothetical protein
MLNGSVAIMYEVDFWRSRAILAHAIIVNAMAASHICQVAKYRRNPE